jgi:DNA-binding CsgD family transcriptional regulator
MLYPSTKNKTIMSEILSLSPQEKRILVALSYGSLYKEIAADYNISINTVKKHLKSVYRKLKVNKRTAAVEKLFVSSYAIQQGAAEQN